MRGRLVRNSNDGLLYIMREDGTFFLAEIVQDNVLKIRDGSINHLTSETKYEAVYFPTTDNTLTFLLIEPEKRQQVDPHEGMFGGGGGGRRGVYLQEEGIEVNGLFRTINFIGADVTVTDGGGGVANVTITAGGMSSARNGLSVSGTFVELGGTLIHDTDIDFAGFDLSFSNVPVSVAPSSFLTLDAGGNIQANPSGATNGLFWALNGNVTAGEYIGTNNAQDFPIYTNGVERMQIASTGEIGINTAPVVGAQVTVEGSGTTSATWIERWYDATPTLWFGVRDDGYIQAGTSDGSLAIGYEVGYNPALAENEFIGFRVGMDLTTGNNNVGFGSMTLFHLTSGARNTAMGNSALASATAMAMSGDDNTAVGMQAGNENTSGTFNTYLGSQTGKNTTSGGRNTFLGAEAGFGKTTGSYNVAIGYDSLYSSGAGGENVAVGMNAGFSNTTGSTNVFLGFQAGYYQTTTPSRLWIDNDPRANLQAGRNSALIYGKFSTTAPVTDNQFLVFNAVLYLLDTVTATYWSGVLVNGVLTWTDTGSANAPA